MKKIIITLLAVLTIGGLSTFSESQAANAATIWVIKSYHFDHNTITGKDGNITHQVYRNIPGHSYRTSYRNYVIGSGWNYTRYQHVNYFKGGY